MAQTKVEHARIANSPISEKFKIKANIETLSGDKTLVVTDCPLQILDPAGARNVDLPAEADSAEMVFIIVNTADAAENISVRNDAAGAIVTVGQNECGFCVCDGTTWRGYSWVA